MVVHGDDWLMIRTARKTTVFPTDFNELLIILHQYAIKLQTIGDVQCADAVFDRELIPAYNSIYHHIFIDYVMYE